MDNWGECKPPSISTGTEALVYNYGSRNTKKRSENEYKSKAKSISLPEREVIQHQEILNNNTSIPGEFIDNVDKKGEKVIIPTIYSSPRPSELKKEEEVVIPKSKTPQKKTFDKIKNHD
ncbi:hypothetical protein O181_069310 [Austropuccinia psidii MF-1]|uniref:Uncharacterized protein n=1 Tax=Austropuccinia psidii MF-1 TaxID=1389203 RepID=A0A9Q3F2S0_9BASI|nr:hypothetical protein [Austropuccinia psidii MF-1]